MKVSQGSELKALATKLAADPEVLKNVKKSTEQFRKGQTVTLSELGRRPSVVVPRVDGMAALSSRHSVQSENGPDRELNYAAAAFSD